VAIAFLSQSLWSVADRGPILESCKPIVPAPSTRCAHASRFGRNAAGLDGRTINSVMVIVTDGANNNGCQPVKQAAARAKRIGFLIATVGLGGSRADADCLRDIASSDQYFYEVRTTRQLIQSLEQFRVSISQAALRTLYVVDVLPDSMAYIPGSASPPAEVSGDQKTLEWDAGLVPSSGITFTFRIRPLKAGSHRTHSSAMAEYGDIQNLTGTVEFPVRLVSVMRSIWPPAPIAP
jgi:hypothetical protein